MTNTITRLAVTAGSSIGACGGKWLKQWTFSSSPPPPPFPSLLFVFSFFSSSQAGMRNTLLTGAAHQTHRLYLSPGRVDRRLQSGVISALFTTIEFIARIKRWSTDKQSSITVPLARLLSFYRHESENFADFSLRWTLLWHNALCFCTAEPCNESQGQS